MIVFYFVYFASRSVLRFGIWIKTKWEEKNWFYFIQTWIKIVHFYFISYSRTVDGMRRIVTALCCSTHQSMNLFSTLLCDRNCLFRENQWNFHLWLKKRKKKIQKNMLLQDRCIFFIFFYFLLLFISNRSQPFDLWTFVFK